MILQPIGIVTSANNQIFQQYTWLLIKIDTSLTWVTMKDEKNCKVNLENYVIKSFCHCTKLVLGIYSQGYWHQFTRFSVNDTKTKRRMLDLSIRTSKIYDRCRNSTLTFLQILVKWLFEKLLDHHSFWDYFGK